MAGTLKKVRFKVAWQNYRVGDEITPNGALRDWLVGQGYVEIVEVEQPSRPARMTRQAAAKIVDASKRLFGNGET
jgi:hypothetical protein